MSGPFVFAPAETSAFSRGGVGRFVVLCRLGTGGMSEVFLALQKGVGGFSRPVVLKRILSSVKGEPEFLRMFVQEAQITAGLSHASIAHLYDLVIENEHLFMVMEFVGGGTLVEVAKACALKREAIPTGFTLAVARDTALALHYAHQYVDAAGGARPVVHRDVAEKNIMVAFDGTTKLLDFGIARQSGQLIRTATGTIKGTAGYMSPEQLRGERVDARADVFSLGVVLHECLTGQRLFKGSNIALEMKAVFEGTIPSPTVRNPEVNKALEQAVFKALARDREARFSTALELARAIEGAGLPLWTPEQRGVFVRRMFVERLEQLQQLLGVPASTAEVGVSSQPPTLLARARTGQAIPRPKSDRVPPPVQEVEPEDRTHSTASGTTPAPEQTLGDDEHNPFEVDERTIAEENVPERLRQRLPASIVTEEHSSELSQSLTPAASTPGALLAGMSRQNLIIAVSVGVALTVLIGLGLAMLAR